MGRLFLMIVLGISAAMYFPDSRQAIINKAMPVLTPLLTRGANNEMGSIASKLIDYDQGGRSLPSRRTWIKWLEDNFPGENSLDPWGSVYQFYAWPDSLVIFSYGPDKERDTEDDVRFVQARTSWRRR